MLLYRHKLKKHMENKSQHSDYPKKFVSQALYGTLLVMSLIVAIENQQKTAGQVIISLLTTVLAFTIAHLYSDIMAERMVSKEKLTREKLKAIFYEIAPIGLGSHVPTIIFFLALFQLISIEKAFFFAKIVGLDALFVYGYAIGKYSDRPKYVWVLSGLVNVLVGGIIIFVKALVH